jgi:hypothetical protein
VEKAPAIDETTIMMTVLALRRGDDRQFAGHGHRWGLRNLCLPAES